MVTLDQMWFVLCLPLFALAGLILNLALRARGGRSLTVRVKAFGVEMTVDSHVPLSHSQEVPSDETAQL